MWKDSCQGVNSCLLWRREWIWGRSHEERELFTLKFWNFRKEHLVILKEQKTQFRSSVLGVSPWGWALLPRVSQSIRKAPQPCASGHGTPSAPLCVRERTPALPDSAMTAPKGIKQSFHLMLTIVLWGGHSGMSAFHWRGLKFKGRDCTATRRREGSEPGPSTHAQGSFQPLPPFPEECGEHGGSAWM